MKFHNAGLITGAYIIEPKIIEDERGFFAEVLNHRQLAEMNLPTKYVQQNISFNKKAGTLRGMHYQVSPHGEFKIIRCTKGKIYDVILDIRDYSSTYGEWSCLEISAENHLSLFIPQGVAHGYQTLEDDTEVSYQVSEYYHPESARTLKWNDPKYAIKWPLEVTSISEKDK